MRLARTRSLLLVGLALVLTFAALQAAPADSSIRPLRRAADVPEEEEGAYFVFDCPPHPETFVFKVTDPAQIKRARDILAGRAAGILNGVIIRQPVYYNAPWSFHLDPRSVTFTDFAVELCDSNIRLIEENLESAYPTWCPWATHLLREIDPPAKPGTVNLPPTVSMTNPYVNDNPRMTAPVTATLAANADDADGRVSKVQFFVGGQLIGEDDSYPYSVIWSNVAAGRYLLSARAVDEQGAVARSKGVYFTADPAAANPIDQTPFFVRQHYYDFLNREPDPPGYQGWQDILNKCPAGDTRCDRIEVSSAFFRSAEFQQRGYFVYRFYPTAFGRVPRFDEFMPDWRSVSGFLTPAELEAAKAAFSLDFAGRTEFKNRYGALTDPAAYVDALAATAGVTLAGRQSLIEDLASGRKTRAEVLRAVAESAEVYARYFDEAFVVMQYFGYLRRDPDILYLDWIKVLKQTGDYRVMINGFMNSREYRQRFGP